MAIQKKHAKARLDKYYYLAKEKGYRARAAFKLIQLNKKYSFLQQSKCLIDLCAAPGSWLQVAAETMPVKSLIIGVDLSPIKPIPRTITFQGDITTEKCRATIRGHLKSWRADTVIHDGAPNVGTAWVQDAFTQNELVLASLKLATEFLTANGTFVTKVFRSKDSNKLEWIFKQLFDRVEQTKPPSSRNVSAETFYVCRGYKAPKNLDSRFLDPKYAFAEIEDGSKNNEARVFNPEKKKRRREGYEEGDWTQFHEIAASEFIQTSDPIEMLGSLNRFHFRQADNGNIALAALEKLPETTQEIRDCCADLKVLGRKEFKLLLRWRLKVRDRFGFRQKKQNQNESKDVSGQSVDAMDNNGERLEESATVEAIDEDVSLEQDVRRMKDAQDRTKRKERRRENERKQREITRMQLNMTTPFEIGIEAAGPEGGDATFRLRDVDRSGVGRQILKGRMHSEIEYDRQNFLGDSVDAAEPENFEDDDRADDDDGDALERDLDTMYEVYQERRAHKDTIARAKRAREKARGDHGEFEGFDGGDQELDLPIDAPDEDRLVEDRDDYSSDESDPEQNVNRTTAFTTDLHKVQGSTENLTRRAANFFDQDVFREIQARYNTELSYVDSSSHPKSTQVDQGVGNIPSTPTEETNSALTPLTSVQHRSVSEGSPAEDRLETTTSDGGGRPNIDIITAEAMTLAHALATGKVTKAQLSDDNFNKYSHRDVDGLPDWFLDDEGKHSKIQRPISAEAAKAIKEKLRALNARPIKKVREAKARKTLRVARRLEKLKKKSEGLIEGSDLSEKDKAKSISQLMAKAKRGSKKRQPVKVVKAGGVNKGSGRPRGVKGKYKMVDSRLKKDVRAEKRLSKKNKMR